MDNFFLALKENGILPVICIKSEEELKTIISALLKTPIRCIEITLRHPFAPEAIKYIKENHPEIMVGAGTVVSRSLLKTAIESGADFFVSPGFDKKIIKIAKRKKLVFLPGICTPSEILAAQKMGFKTLKLFPAECSGGVDLLRLYEGAFPDVEFIPTGGITKDNVLNYVLCDNVLACGGSFMIPKVSLASRDSEDIALTIENCISKIKETSK